MTELPVLGVPIESRALKGLDSLLSIAQMPAGVPVGTLAIGEAGATNAGLLAAQILALDDSRLAARVAAYRAAQTDAIPEAVEDDALSAPLPPGSTIGILGGGQLGRMLAVAASRLGLKTHIYSDEAGVPAFDVAAAKTVGPYDDADAIARFADAVDVVTCEFENVPAETLEAAAARGAGVSRRQILRRGARSPRREGFRHRARHSRSRLMRASTASPTCARHSSRIKPPALLKTRRFGYDGKGQVLIRDSARGRSRVRGDRRRPRRARRPGAVRARNLGDRRARPGRRACLLRPGRERAPERHPRHQPRAGPHRTRHDGRGGQGHRRQDRRRAWPCRGALRRAVRARGREPCARSSTSSPRASTIPAIGRSMPASSASSRTMSGRFAAGRSAIPRATAMR